MTIYDDAARTLDLELPGWHNRISTADLSMKDGKRCVLGQLYGDYGSDGAESFMRRYRDVCWPDGEFLGPFSSEASVNEWIDQIQERKVASKPAKAEDSVKAYLIGFASYGDAAKVAQLLVEAIAQADINVSVTIEPDSGGWTLKVSS